MASSHQIFIDPHTGRKTVMAELLVTVASSAASEVVTLDGTFTNTPSMMVSLPFGSDGSWATAYNAAGPTITVSTSDETVLDDIVIPVILVAVDRVEA